MIIRPARKDDAHFIAKMILAALHIEEDDNSILARRMEEFVLADDTLYSWHRGYIAVDTPDIKSEDDGQTYTEEIPAGLCLAYDGIDYHERRINTFTMKCSDGASVAEENPVLATQEDEAGTGEYYIDSLAVASDYRGRGIGKMLLSHAIEQGIAKGLRPTLLVDPDNAPALRLYTSLGFQFFREQEAFGIVYHKYQYHPDR